MRRRVFNFVVLLCLVVEIGLVAEWIRSYWVKDEIVVRRDMVLPGTFHSFFEQFYAATGMIEIDLETGHSQPLTYVETGYLQTKRGRFLFNYGASNLAERLGFRFVSIEQRGFIPYRSTVIDMPFWVPVVLFGLLPIWWFHPGKKWIPGTCKTCGYDLRATPDRCPECGSLK